MATPESGSSLKTLQNWAAVLGNPNTALLLAAAAALIIFVRQRRPSRQEVSSTVEDALMSAGIIILITSAGGAFGGMLKAAGVDGAIASLFPSDGEGGVALLCLAFLLTSLLKFAQGSSTVAVTTGSSMVAAMTAELALSYHPVYLAMAVGCGAMVGSWMNDSGFWIYCQMGGLTEKEALKTWTPMLAITGIAGMLTTVVLAIVLPLN